MAEQWVITVVAEGADNPFDIVAEFLTELRVRGEYDIISSAITPASGIGRSTTTFAKCGDNDNYDGCTVATDICTVCGKSHNPRSYGDILAGIDGHDPATYAGSGHTR